MKIPKSPPTLESLLETVGRERLLPLLANRLSDEPYHHWDEIRHRPPPDGLTTEEWWLSLHFQRVGKARQITLQDIKGEPFSWFPTDTMLRLLHQLDMGAGGTVQMPDQVTNSNTRDQYYVSSLMEEAITSSQLEGAATTREVARDMLRSQRRPKDEGERMILNNYLTMRQLGSWKKEKLTPELVLAIHRKITEGTMDDPTAAGRLRRADESVEVVSEQTEEVLHVPPKASELETRMRAMCDFANQPDDSDPFVHPIIRGIILHFWLAYDHPFKDGNGRTARALFYWLVLSRGFWLFEFVSISQILLRSRGKYGKAFLKTETDNNDLNYFILHQLNVIELANQSLHDYIARKTQELEEARRALRRMGEFNHRQEALLTRALRHPGTLFTIDSHQNSHGISYATARSDLLKLVEQGLLDQRTRGKAFVFESPGNLQDRLCR